MEWKQLKYGDNWRCDLGEGFRLAVTQSLLKSDTYTGFINGLSCCNSSTSEEAKEICEIGAKNIIKNLYLQYCK